METIRIKKSIITKVGADLAKECVEYDAEQLASYFDHVSIGQKQDPIYHHVPERVEATETTADEELMR